MQWRAFVRAYDKSSSKGHQGLFRLIISDFSQLLDAELGEGTFSRFVDVQKMIKEYQALRPPIEFYIDHGFLLPRQAENNRTRQEKLRLKILKDSLKESGAVELKEKVLASKAIEKIKEKYGFLLDCMYPREMLDRYGLCDPAGRFSYENNNAVVAYLRIMGAMLQGEVDKLELLEEYYPDLYKEFLLLFHCVV
jgi:hypothetical protein